MLTVRSGFDAVLLSLPFASVALRTLLDLSAEGADASSLHLADVATRLVETTPAVDLRAALSTLLVLRSLGHVAFPDLGAPCALTASGHRLLGVGDALSDVAPSP